MGRSLQRDGIRRRAALFIATHFGQLLIGLLVWSFIGRLAFGSDHSAAWLWAIGLVLLTLVPLQLWNMWSAGVISLDFGVRLKQKLLVGAFNLPFEQIRTGGIGEHLSRVFESDGFEALLLSGATSGDHGARPANGGHSHPCARGRAVCSRGSGRAVDGARLRALPRLHASAPALGGNAAVADERHGRASGRASDATGAGVGCEWHRSEDAELARIRRKPEHGSLAAPAQRGDRSRMVAGGPCRPRLHLRGRRSERGYAGGESRRCAARAAGDRAAHQQRHRAWPTPTSPGGWSVRCSAPPASRPNSPARSGRKACSRARARRQETEREVLLDVQGLGYSYDDRALPVLDCCELRGPRRRPDPAGGQVRRRQVDASRRYSPDCARPHAVRSFCTVSTGRRSAISNGADASFSPRSSTKTTF